MASSEASTQASMHWAGWKTICADGVNFPSFEKSEMNYFGSNLGNPLDGRTSSKVLKSHTTLDSSDTRSALQSSWIQRLIPSSRPLQVEQLHDGDALGTGNDGLSYLHSDRRTITALDSPSIPEKEFEGPVYENNRANIFGFHDERTEHLYCSQQVARGSGTDSGKYGTWQTAQPETQVWPKPLPTVESLLPSHSNKANETRDASAEPSSSIQFQKLSWPSVTRASNEMIGTSSFPDHGKPSEPTSSCGGYNSVGVTAARKFTGFKSLWLAESRRSTPSPGSRIEVAARTTDVPIATSFGGKECFLNTRGQPHFPAARPVFTQVGNYNNLHIEERHAIHRADCVNSERSEFVGSRSTCKRMGLYGEDRGKSVYNTWDDQEYLKSGEEKHFDLSPDRRKNLGASANETHHPCSWRYNYFEHNNGDAGASHKTEYVSTEEGSGQCKVKHVPQYGSDISALHGGASSSKSEGGHMIPGGSFQLDLCFSRKFQHEQPGSSLSFSFNLKGSDAETVGVEWPIPLAAQMASESSRQSESTSRTTNLPREVCDNAFPSDKLTKIHSNFPMPERRSGGEGRTVFDFRKPCSYSFEITPDDLAHNRPLNQVSPIRDASVDNGTLNDVRCSFFFKANKDDVRCENMCTIPRQQQEQITKLDSGLAVSARQDSKTGMEVAEDEVLGRMSKQSNLLASSQQMNFVKGSVEFGPKSNPRVGRWLNSAPVGAKVEKAVNESSPAGSCMNFNGSASVGGPVVPTEAGTLASRHLNTEAVGPEVMPFLVLGKRFRDEGKQFARSMSHTASEGMESEAVVTGLGWEGPCNKPQMWLQRWCTATSTRKTEDFSYLGRESRVAVAVNSISQHSPSLRGQREDGSTKAHYETRGLGKFDCTQGKTEIPGGRCSVQGETSKGFPSVCREVKKRHCYEDGNASCFSKRLFTPTASAMAIVGTTARHVHERQPQNSLFGFWSSPKGPTVQTSEPQDEVHKDVVSTPKGKKEFVQVAVEYPACVLT